MRLDPFALEYDRYGCRCWLMILTMVVKQWRIQDFPEGGREPSRGGVNTPNFPENCMKSKEFGRPGGGVRPSRPP